MQSENQVMQINIDDIIPNRFQPRIAFDETGLNELAASIKEHGIIQPLVLRKLGKKYEIIAGERRYKASQLAGLTTVPAIISNIDDNKSAEIALVENIQRKDLTAIEEARSYKNILDKGYLTQEQLAKKMGLSQSAISNKLRLLNLDDSVQQALLDNKISERHARSLLSLDSKEEQKKWLDKIISDRLTVRQLDQKIKENNNSIEEDKVPLVQPSPNVDELQNISKDIQNNVSSNKNTEEILMNEQQPNPFGEPKIEISENVDNEVLQSPVVPEPENPLEVLTTPSSTPNNAGEMNTIDNSVPQVDNPTISMANSFEIPEASNDYNSTIPAPSGFNEYSENPFAGSDIEPNTSQLSSQEVSIPMQPNVNGNRFFNQLEEQPVDMNNLNPFNGQNQFADDNNQIPNNGLEVFDMSNNNQVVQQPMPGPMSIDDMNFPNNGQVSTIDELSPNNKFFQPIQEPTIDTMSQSIEQPNNFVNPMDNVNTIDPNMNAQVTLDVSDAINSIKNTVNDLNNKGFNVIINETDLNNSYQINIIINK